MRDFYLFGEADTCKPLFTGLFTAPITPIAKKMPGLFYGTKTISVPFPELPDRPYALETVMFILGELGAGPIENCYFISYEPVLSPASVEDMVKLETTMHEYGLPLSICVAGWDTYRNILLEEHI